MNVLYRLKSYKEEKTYTAN